MLYFWELNQRNKKRKAFYYVMGIMMKITALIENKASSNLYSEHGLAIHIDYNGKRYLLDTGASSRFLLNADKLGIDLSEIDTCVLSHCHFDHSGGYESFFTRNENAKVYLQSESKEQYYLKFAFIKYYVGIPRGILDKYKERFLFVDGNFQLDPGVWLISHKTKNLETRGKKAHMYRKAGKGFVADNFGHEQSLVFETERGLVILNSCCHGGVDNIVNEVKEAFNHQEVYAVIGGFHLMGIRGTKSMSGSNEDIMVLGKKLNENVNQIYTCHCTGDPAYRILKGELGEKLHYFSTGTTFEI
jgi:7,8-dihydropterin-6-yl-methyl-4-(beta-D-ribofuranosyl)aminobenzene 5'-phosphate synthase